MSRANRSTKLLYTSLGGAERTSASEVQEKQLSKLTPNSLQEN